MHRTPVRCLLVALLLILPLPLAAQSGYAGDWVLDTDRSDPLRRGGGPLPEVDMTIELKGDDLGISRLYRLGGREQQVSFTYVTDGKQHELPSPMGGTRKTRAKWKKERLQVSYSMSRTTQRGAFDIDVTETWKLVDGGDEIEIAYSSRMGERSFQRKEYYVRSAGLD